jgi:hypothetical protein
MMGGSLDVRVALGLRTGNEGDFWGGLHILASDSTLDLHTAWDIRRYQDEYSSGA